MAWLANDAGPPGSSNPPTGVLCSRPELGVQPVGGIACAEVNDKILPDIQLALTPDTQ